MRTTKPSRYVVLSAILLLTASLSALAGPRAAAPAAPATPAVPAPPLVQPGLYMIDHTGDRDPDHYYLTGKLRTFDWGWLNPGDGSYYWGSLDNYIASVAATGKRAAFGISPYNGRCCGGINAMPAWLWQNNPNTAVITSTCSTSAASGCIGGQWRVPRYWDAYYLVAYQGFIQALGERYRNDPRVEWIALGIGTYGESAATSSQSDTEALVSNGLTDSNWMSAAQAIIATYHDAFVEGGVLKKALFAQIAPYTLREAERWELANYAVPLGIGISLNGLTADFNNAWRGPLTCSQTNLCGTYDTVLAHYRAVPIAFETYHYMLCDNQALYWGMLSGLDKKADVLRLNDDLFFEVDPNTGAISDLTSNLEVFAWVKDYVGKTAQTTPSVWVALREHRNPTLYCYVGTEPTWYPETGNFSFFLTQNDDVPGGLSVPETNLAGADEFGWCNPNVPLDPSGRPYPCYPNPYNPDLPAGREGWVARRTGGAANPYLWFQVDDGYYFNGDATVKIAVTYADIGTDSFKIEYESTSGLAAALLEGTMQSNLVKTNSHTWRTATFLAPHARLANGLLGGSDFRLNSNGDGDEHVHLVVLNKTASGYAGPPPTFTPAAPPPVCPDFLPPPGVGVEDIEAMVGHWGETPAAPGWDKHFDLVEDERIDIRDLALVTARWGAVCG